MSQQLSEKSALQIRLRKPKRRIRRLYALLVLLLEIPLGWLGYLYFLGKGLSIPEATAAVLVTGLVAFCAFNGLMIVCLISDPDFR